MNDPNYFSPPNASGALRLKSYFSGTVEAALDLARRELGDDAVLINARPASAETRQYGAYEVVFGIANSSTNAPKAVPPPLPSQPDAVRTLTDDVAELRRQVRALLDRIPTPEKEDNPPPTGLTTDATLGRPDSKKTAVMLVGPPGVGKTSTLMKIAARYGVNAQRSTQVLTVDTFRPAAADQLQTLCAILGTGCDVVESASLLSHALAEHAGKDLILVDTPGFAIPELNHSIDLIRTIGDCHDIDVHLVLSASMKTSDAIRLGEAYSIFRPHKLIFTRLDETQDRTSIAEVAPALKLPVSFVSTGQNIPGAIEPATRRRLSEWLASPTPAKEPLRSKGAGA